ncbi:MAG TPA: DNA polymerase III subunit alpha, partial [Cyclobacteriaceae bacterium]|nr:DNA polymerase III subunit alpha [Cyclobacteriaceae bacterium]
RRNPEDLGEQEFIGVRKNELNEYAVLESGKKFEHKFVALHPVTFLPPEKGQKGQPIYRDHNIHRLLRCIANNTLLSKLPPDQQASREEFMLPVAELEAQFGRYPALIENARRLTAQCTITCEPRTDKNKKSFTESKAHDLQLLREQTRKGYKKIFPSDPDGKIWARIENELRIIEQKQFTAYYLITHDLINFAKKKNFDFVGRGSGANSTVAFCLGITNVNPIDLNLYFERFLNEERTSPPDFDIDFSWDNRDEIYEYLFNTHGRDHVCLLGTHVTYQGRSILRELAKVFGLPRGEIDELVENRNINRGRDHIGEMVHAYARLIIDRELPSNFSIHAGGVLITEKPIYKYTATEFPSKGYPVSHFEMHSAEDFGLFKFDILSQRGLGHIKETVRHVKRNRGVDVDVHRFEDFKRDEKIKDLMRNSKAMGCFYVESPAMRMLLSKLHCDDYLTLVAASSIIRPGVARSGMMRAYIERFHAVRRGQSYESIHPKMDELMADTFGVMVYQEDVIKVAHEFAGLTLTEADVLRRGMSGKYRSRTEFQRVREKFFRNCAAFGYDQKITNRVWYEIESFSGYSFAKGHSASYAVESYQSLFLKAHYPLEFMVGVINNFGGFYKTEFYFHEARMSGAKIWAPCVNKSEQLTTIYGEDIYMGFVHVKSLESKITVNIAQERVQNGDYRSLDNFLKRMPGIGLEQLRILIRIGAFRFTGKTKQRLLWEAMLYFNGSKTKPATSADLFDTEPNEFPLPVLQRNPTEDAYDEIELLGFPLQDPFTLLASKDYGTGTATARDLSKKTGTNLVIVGYIVTTKETRTAKGELMYFGTFYDASGEFFDTVHFPDVAKKYPFRGRGFYRINGKVTEEFGVYQIEVAEMVKIPMIHKRPETAMQESELTRPGEQFTRRQ